MFLKCDTISNTTLINLSVELLHEKCYRVLNIFYACAFFLGICLTLLCALFIYCRKKNIRNADLVQYTKRRINGRQQVQLLLSRRLSFDNVSGSDDFTIRHSILHSSDWDRDTPLHTELLPRQLRSEPGLFFPGHNDRFSSDQNPNLQRTNYADIIPKVLVTEETENISDDVYVNSAQQNVTKDVIYSNSNLSDGQFCQTNTVGSDKHLENVEVENVTEKRSEQTTQISISVTGQQINSSSKFAFDCDFTPRKETELQGSVETNNNHNQLNKPRTRETLGRLHSLVEFFPNSTKCVKIDGQVWKTRSNE